MRWLTALKTWEVWTKAAEARLNTKLRGIFDGAMRESILQLQAMGQVPATDAARMKIINEFKAAEQPFKDTMADHAVESANMGRKQTYEDLARQGIEMDFSEFNRMTSRQIRLHSFEASDLTMNRMTGDVMGNLTQSYKQGLGIKETAARLQSDFQNMKDYELLRIARTETNAAASLGAHYTMEELNVEYEQWWTAADDRVREQHIWMHGQITKVGDSFSNGLAHPHDRQGLIEEWINCRCRPVPFIMPHGYAAPTGRTYFYEDEIVLRESVDDEDFFDEDHMDKLRGGLAGLAPNEKLTKIDEYLNNARDQLLRKGLTKKQVAEKMMKYDYSALQPAWLQSAETFATTAPFEGLAGAVMPGQRHLIKGPIKGALNKGVNFIRQKVHPELVKNAGAPGVNISPAVSPGGYVHRASYHSGKQIIDWSGNNHIYVHEYGHHLMERNIPSRNLIGRFYTNKTQGETLKQIYVGEDEWARRDLFFNLYAGKEYPGMGHGTELLSVGLEEMSRNPGRFLDKAPAHYNLVYAVMRGLFR